MIIRIELATIVLLVAFLLLPAVEAEPILTDQKLVKLDLDTAKKYAVAHNYQIIALRHEVEQMTAALSRTHSTFLPTIGVAGGVESNQGEKDSQSDPFAYAYGSVNLFNGFRDIYQRDISKSELEKAKTKLKFAEFKVGLEVEESFHTYLFKKSLIELKDQEIVQNELHQKLVQQTKARGLISDADVMEFEYKASILNSELVFLKQELEDSRSNLKRLLGEELGGNIQPVGRLQHQHVKGSLRELLLKIEDGSENVKIAALDVEIARSERSQIYSRWLPRIDFEARSGFLTEQEDQEKKAKTNLMLIAKMDLFSGGDSSYEMLEKIASRSKREAELKEQINNAIRNVEMGFRNLKVIETRADLEKNNVTFAKRYYDAILSEYKRGYKNSYDLSSAAERLSLSGGRKIALEFEFIKQRIAIEKELGTPLEIDIMNFPDEKKDENNRKPAHKN